MGTELGMVLRNVNDSKGFGGVSLAWKAEILAIELHPRICD